MKEKLAVFAVVTAMVCLSLANVSPSAGAGDVGGDVVQQLTTSPVGIFLKDVAWKDDGSMALAVGWDSNGDGRNAAYYYPDTNAWTYLTTYPYAAGYTLNACVWVPANNMFYLVGNNLGGSNTAFYVNEPAPLQINELQTGNGASPTTTLEDIATDEYGNGFAVGPNNVVKFFRNMDGAWWDVADFEGVGVWDYHAVDYEEGYHRYYAVGEPVGGGQAMVVYTNSIPDFAYTPSNHYDYTAPPEMSTYPELYSIAWNNNPNMAPSERYALLAGNDIIVGIKPIDAGIAFYPGTANYPSRYYNYIAWDESTWEEATILADLGATFYVYQFQNSTKDIVLLDTVTSPDTFEAVDYRPPQSPGWGFVVGSTDVFQLNTNAFHSDTEITLNTDMPHIFTIDMWKMTDGIGGSSKLNAQVDVDETYTFGTMVNYTVGGVNEVFDGNDNVRINLYAYYDEGETAGSAPEITWATTYNRTRQFSLEWVEGDGGPTPESANMVYPIGSPGTDEFILNSWWRDPTAYGADGNSFIIYFNVSFGSQTWAADGNGFGNGAAPNIWDDAQANNDPDSWDLAIRIYDNDYSTAQNFTYEEFGVFRMTNITVAGNPSGNAPPGSNDNLIGSSFVSCSSNIPYYVNVSIPDLARVGGGGSITANNIAVRSSSTLANNTNTQINSSWTFGRLFPAADADLGVWGNVSQAPANWVMPAPKNGTTAHGPWGSDFNGYGSTQVTWYATVPAATAEGVYRATITFKMAYY